MGNLSSLTFMLGANIKDFQTKMRKVSADLQKTGKQMKGMGKSMSMYVTAPIMAMGAASVAAFEQQAQAEAKLAAQIRQNGKDVQWYMNHYKNLASSLQSVTTVGDETTLGLIQLAESMQAADPGAAAQNAIGLSKALGVDLNSAIKMVVLAQKGEYTMLQRYVPSLKTAGSETEKAAILSKLFADGMALAKTEAQTGLGPLTQLKNTIGDISEEFGALILEALRPVVGALKNAANWFQGLSSKGKQFIGIGLGIAAAIGPVMLIFGQMLTVLPAIGAAFSAMMGPIGLVVLAIAAIGAAFVYIYGNWEAVKERMGDWSWWKNALIQAAQWLIEYSPISLLIKAVNELIDFFGGDPIPNPFESLADALQGAKDDTKEYQHDFKGFGQTMKDVAGEVMQAMGMFSAGTTTSTQEVTSSMRQALPVLDQLKAKVGDLREMASKGLKSLLPIDQKVLQSSIQETAGSIWAYEEAVVANWTAAQDSIKGSFQQSMADMAVSLGEAIGDMVSGVDVDFGAKVLGIIGSFVSQIGSALITYGTLMLAFSILSKTITPWTAAAAIVVGIAAVAAGKALRNKAAKGVSGAAQMADGGTVPPGFPNDTYPALLTSGETVVPKPIPLGSAPGGSDSSMKISGSSRISGKDLLIIFDKAKNDRSRIRGY